jgi:hypothetical protein
MPGRRPNPAPTSAEKLPHPDIGLLLQSLHNNAESAREQIERSRQNIAESSEIINRVKRTVAQAERIKRDIGGGAPPNPPIPPEADPRAGQEISKSRPRRVIPPVDAIGLK